MNISQFIIGDKNNTFAYSFFLCHDNDRSVIINGKYNGWSVLLDYNNHICKLPE